MVSNRQEQIEIFERRLKELKDFDSTFNELNDKGLLIYKDDFYRVNANYKKVLISKRKEQLKLFEAEAIKQLSFKGAYKTLKQKGMITYAEGFFTENSSLKMLSIKKNKKREEAKLLKETAISENIDFTDAYKRLKKEQLITFSHQVLMNVKKINTIEDIKDPNQSKRDKEILEERAKKIVQKYEETYFEGRIMTIEVKNAYKLLKL